MLRRAELWHFVRENARRVSHSRQTPNLLPGSRDGEIVLRLAPAPPHPGPALAAGEASAGSGGAQSAGSAAVAPGSDDPSEAAGHGALRLAVLHAGPGAVARVRETLAGVRVVSEEESPDLLWDAHARQVITGMADVAAHDVDLEALPGVIDKWGAVAAVRALSARNGLRMRIDPHDGVHRRGSRITVRVEGLAHPRLTVFGLSGNGRIHYLYPLPGDAPATLAAGSFELPEFEVTPPFGADHVVAVSAGSALDGLNAALERLDGRVAAAEAVKLLAEARAGAEGWRSGVQGLYTAP